MHIAPLLCLTTLLPRTSRKKALLDAGGGGGFQWYCLPDLESLLIHPLVTFSLFASRSPRFQPYPATVRSSAASSFLNNQIIFYSSNLCEHTRRISRIASRLTDPWSHPMRVSFLGPLGHNYGSTLKAFRSCIRKERSHCERHHKRRCRVGVALSCGSVLPGSLMAKDR